MDEKSFVYWLQGFFEIANPASLDEKQIQIIKDHIALVLKKETPNRLEIKVIEDKSLAPDEIKIVPQPLFPTIPTYPTTGVVACSICGKTHSPFQCPSLTVTC